MGFSGDHKGRPYKHLWPRSIEMTAEKTKLTRQQMCDRLAMEFQDGWIV